MHESYSVTRPWNRVTLYHNTFLNNQADAMLSTEKRYYNEPQASSVYMIGGIDATFEYNTFAEHVGGLYEEVRVNGSDIHNFMPFDYFRYSQASIIHIEYFADS